jgi:UDP-N-acetylglucosamine:LPS N-acetylglucosamine transferase
VNAQYLAERGAAVILQDAELPVKTLGVLREMIGDQQKRDQMRQAMTSLARPEAAKKIAGQLYGLASSLRGVP